MIFYSLNNYQDVIRRNRPVSIASIKGGAGNEQIFGKVKFFNVPDGTLVVADIFNLPKTETNIFGFHIHENGNCEGDFSSAGPHLGPGEHPNHTGDMPPLFGVNGRAFLAFLDGRFSAKEVVGRSVIIHDMPDDFTSQPAGNSGKKIACGLIVLA